MRSLLVTNRPVEMACPLGAADRANKSNAAEHCDDSAHGVKRPTCVSPEFGPISTNFDAHTERMWLI